VALAEERSGCESQAWAAGEEEGVDVGELRIGDGFAGIRRHLG
jgi:hypothetical protein